MSKKNRVLPMLLAAAVLFAVLSSLLFIAVEAGHDCSGEDCPVCCQIALCENMLKAIGQAVIVVVLAALSGIFTPSLPSFENKRLFNTSLVALKVKLSD